MDTEFMAVLDRVRERAGIPFVLNSAYRSPAYEKSKGRSGTGDHPQRCGVDVRCNTSANRLKIIRAAILEGVERIGIAKTYIHLGGAKDVGHPAGIWHYYD